MKKFRLTCAICFKKVMADEHDFWDKHMMVREHVSAEHENAKENACGIPIDRKQAGWTMMHVYVKKIKDS